MPSLDILYAHITNCNRSSFVRIPVIKNGVQCILDIIKWQPRTVSTKIKEYINLQQRPSQEEKVLADTLSPSDQRQKYPDILVNFDSLVIYLGTQGSDWSSNEQ